MTPNYWIFFDYDDTIGGVKLPGSDEVVMNADAYSHALDNFAETMESLGFDGDESLEKQVEIDVEMCGLHGFDDMGRFARSMVATYEAFCQEHDQVEDPVVAERIRQIGWSVFTDVEYHPLPAAESVLEILSKYYNIGIITKGHPLEQRKKALRSGLYHYAQLFFPVRHKSEEDWTNLIDAAGINEQEKLHSWAVGNSMKSDINLPLKLGLNAIHVSSRTWAFESADGYEEPRRERELIVVEHIGDVLKHIPVPMEV